MKLSACWIAKNEEGNIGRSIESVKNVVDDIIVVDTGSEDGTIAEAEAAGARVLNFEWIGDFSAAKNYALKQAENGIVIFLDADEYFYPPLGEAEKARILNAFAANRNVDVASVYREDIQISDGSVMQKGESNRILRHDGHNGFRRKIHEEMMHDDGKPTVMILDLLIKHTGYSREVIGRKLTRNAKMLEDSLAEAHDDTYEAFSHRVYMVREAQISDPAKSFANLKIAIPQTGNWEYGISRYRLNYLTHLFRAMTVAAQNRYYLSRKYVYDKLFTIFKKHYSKYLLGALTDLIYIYWFDQRDDLFLERLEADLDNALQNATDFPHEYYEEDSVMKNLYTFAAVAYSKRGKWDKALKYAKLGYYAPMPTEVSASLVDIVINAGIKGDPVNLIGNLSSLYPGVNPTGTRFILTRLLRDDSRSFYTYFMKQFIATGLAALDDRLFYTLLTEGPQAAMTEAQKACQNEEIGAADSTAVIIYMIAVAYNARGVYESNRAGLGPYARILGAYFDGEPLVVPTEEELSIIRTLYPFIAFLGGKEAGTRMAAVLNKHPRDAFLLKYGYYEKQLDWDEIINIPMDNIEENDWQIRGKRIRAFIGAQRYEEALAEITPFIEKRLISDAADALLLIAELASGDTKKRARQMYDKYIAIVEECVDLNDVKNTGIIASKKNVRAERELAAIKPKDLLSRIDNQKQRFQYNERLDLLSDVLGYYEAQHDIGHYSDGLIELIGAGKDVEQNTEKLKNLLEKIGNTEAAQALTV